MQVEIWSDILCPFCYIGKRKFEKALNNSAHKDRIQIIWKSFQLSPDLVTDTDTSVYEYLAKHKGISMEEARQMTDRVAEMAASEGLEYHFDKAINANSFDAHRFLHLAKNHGLQDEAEETLFEAYFTKGKNIANHETLVQLGTAIGLDEKNVLDVLSSQEYTDEVMQDIYEAQQVGVRGVPFFIFDRKYAVSGAQDTKVFADVLGKSFTEWHQNHPDLSEAIEGK
jgi:predicted DsbA family dithiol-disulfide isomerase